MDEVLVGSRLWVGWKRKETSRAARDLGDGVMPIANHSRILRTHLVVVVGNTYYMYTAALLPLPT